MSLLSLHAFNTAWLGVPFAVGFDPALLRLSAAELEAEAADYRYVEVRCAVDALPTDRLLPANGLVQVDTQLGYQLSLRRLAARPERIDVVPFAESGPPDGRFRFLPFAAERYARLQAVDAAKLDERYQRWALDLVGEHPDGSFQLVSGERVLGYAFGRPVSATEVNLDLVAATPECDVPGLGLYVRALHAYADLGITRVTAAFSAHNLAAVNVHVALGCRITSATDIWLLERA